MSTFEFVTSCSQAGYACYGKHFFDSFTARSQGHRLTIYHESQPFIDFNHLVTWRNLDNDEDRTRFIEDNGNDREKVGTPADPNSQGIRFAHKVFAITDAIRQHTADWVIWVDADVEWVGDITQNRLEQLCPLDADLAFLGRIDAPYTECGFVAYRAAANPVQRLAEDMRRYYTTGEIWTRPKSDWHDSRCFDICRQRSDIAPHRQHNISQGIRGWHPWPSTLLNTIAVHHKGPARKHRAYGKIVK